VLVLSDKDGWAWRYVSPGLRYGDALALADGVKPGEWLAVDRNEVPYPFGLGQRPVEPERVPWPVSKPGSAIKNPSQ
jgi:hypothetical protein